MPQLDFSTYLSQIFWLAVCFTLLYCFIKFWFYPRMQRTLRQRQELTQSLVEDAKNLKIKADELHNAYLIQLEELNTKLEQINEQTKNFCKKHYEAQTDIFEKESAQIKEKLVADLVAWENSIYERSKDIALDLASFTLNKIIPSLEKSEEEKTLDLNKYYDKVKN